MKTQNIFPFRSLVACIFCVTFYFPLPKSLAADGMRRGVVVVTDVKGGVLFTTPANPEPRPLKKGDTLRQGVTIITGKDAEADLAFSNGSVMQVAASSKFVIQEFMQAAWDVDGQSYVSLQAEPTTSEITAYLDFGDVIADVKKLNKNSSLQVTTPLGTAGVRGTAFRLSAIRGPDGRPQLAQLSVARGQVDFGAPNGPQLAVNGGFTSSIGTGGPQGDAPGAPSTTPTNVNSQILESALGLRGLLDAATGELLNAAPERSVSPEQQQAIEQAAQQGEDALIETVSQLVSESPGQAPGIAEAATEQMPVAAPRIAAAAARVFSDAPLVAGVVSSIAPQLAPEIAAAVALVKSTEAPQIAAAVANAVPTLAPQIAARVTTAVPQSTLAVARAVAAEQPQQSDRIADAISQTGGGLDAESVRNAVQQGVQQSTGGGTGTAVPQPPTNDRPAPIVPPVPTPTPGPTPTPTPAPSGL